MHFVHSSAPLCTIAHLFFFKIRFIRKCMKFKFKHSHQISGIQLNKPKSQGKCALCALCAPCALLCTTVHLFFQNIVDKKVYEILIQAFIPNFSSLAQQTKKLGKMCTLCTPVHFSAPLCTCFFQNMVDKKVYKIFIQAFIQNFSSLAQQTKRLGKVCTLCAPVHFSAPLCTIAHRFFQNMVYKKVYAIQIQTFTPNFRSLS